MSADRTTIAGFICASVAGATALILASIPAAAQRIENGTAVFAALDKVTARISKLEVKLGETVRFGALKVTPRVCYSRAPTEQPKTTTFIEVDEVLLDGKEKRIFVGWMFAESPALNPLEHAVYDIWLTDCASPLRPPPSVGERGSPRRAGTGATGAGTGGGQQPTGAQAAPPSAAAGAEPPPDEFRRRRPR